MTKSKAIEILRTFSSDELKRFQDYVHSPFHNKNKNVMNMYDILRKCAPRFDSRRVEKETMFTYLFPGKEYNDIVMRILISDLIKLEEEFLAYLSYERKPADEKKNLLDELKKRGLNNLYLKIHKSLEETFEQTGTINTYYFFDRFDLENRFIDYMISRDQQQSSGKNVLKQGEYLICFAMISLLNIAHELLNHADILNLKFDFNPVEEYLKNFDMESFMNYLQKNNFEYYPVMAIYYYMYLSYTHPENDKYYFELKRLVEEQLELFDKEEQINLLIILESICVTKVSHGKSGFYEELMEVYELLLSRNLFTEPAREHFQTNLFRNIFFTSVVLGRLQWAEKFLETYIGKLLPEHRDNMQHYAKAVISFERGEYENALFEISKVNQKFIGFKYDVKLLELKIHFERRDYEPAYALIDSFSHFLSKNKMVTQTDRERFGKFLKFYKMLLKLSDNGNPGELKKTMNEIASAPNVINRKWLMKKAEELEVML